MNSQQPATRQDGKDMPKTGIEKPPLLDQIKLQRLIEGLTSFTRSIDTDLRFPSKPDLIIDEQLV